MRTTRREAISRRCDRAELLDLVDEVRKIKFVETPVAQMGNLLLDPGDMIDFVKVGAFGRAADGCSIASLIAHACAPLDWWPRRRRPQSAAKKSRSSRVGLLRRLLGQIMARGHRRGAADVGRRSAARSRPACGCGRRRRWRPTGCSAGHVDLAARREVGGVHLEVDAEGRAVVLAHGVDRRPGCGCSGCIPPAPPGRRSSVPCSRLRELAADEEFRVGAHHLLRHR